MRSLKYEASMVVYSLVTGLPLLMTYSFSYNQAESWDKLSWKSTAALLTPASCRVVCWGVSRRVIVFRPGRRR